MYLGGVKALLIAGLIGIDIILLFLINIIIAVRLKDKNIILRILQYVLMMIYTFPSFIFCCYLGNHIWKYIWMWF